MLEEKQAAGSARPTQKICSPTRKLRPVTWKADVYVAVPGQKNRLGRRERRRDSGRLVGWGPSTHDPSRGTDRRSGQELHLELICLGMGTHRIRGGFDKNPPATTPIGFQVIHGFEQGRGEFNHKSTTD
jgi:hypothetical protein